MFKFLRFIISWSPLFFLVLICYFSYQYSSGNISKKDLDYLIRLKESISIKQENNLVIVHSNNVPKLSRSTSCKLLSDPTNFSVESVSSGNGKIQTTFTNGTKFQVCLKLTLENNVVLYGILQESKTGFFNSNIKKVEIVQILGR